MDLLLVLLSATALTALGLVADRIDRGLRGGARAAGRADRDDDGDRPMRLELLGQAPGGLAGVEPDRAGEPVGGRFSRFAGSPASAGLRD